MALLSETIPGLCLLGNVPHRNHVWGRVLSRSTHGASGSEDEGMLDTIHAIGGGQGRKVWLRHAEDSST